MVTLNFTTGVDLNGNPRIILTYGGDSTQVSYLSPADYDFHHITIGYATDAGKFILRNRNVDVDDIIFFREQLTPTPATDAAVITLMLTTLGFGTQPAAGGGGGDATAANQLAEIDAINDTRTFGQRLVELELASYKPREANQVFTSNSFVTPAGASLRNGVTNTFFATSAINNVTGTGLLIQSTGGGAANDTALGAGAQRIIITGTRIIAGVQTPDQTETIIMNGAAVVLSAFTDWLRIDSAYVSQVGAAGANTGIIVITFTGTPCTYQIPVLAMRMYNGGFFVPQNREGYITAFNVTPYAGTSNQDVIVAVWQRAIGAFGTPTIPRIKLFEFGVWQQGAKGLQLDTPIRVLDNKDVELSATSTTGNLGIHLSLEYYIKI